MLKLKFVEPNQLTREDKESLFNLLLMEERNFIQNQYDIETKPCDKTNKSPLFVYAALNKLKLDSSMWFDCLVKDGAYSLRKEIFDYLNKYHLLLLQDRGGKIQGYISYDFCELTLFEKSKKVIEISHMYISNSLNTIKADTLLFKGLEDKYEDNVIYSKVPYAYCNMFNGYVSLLLPMECWEKDANSGVLKMSAGSKYNLF